LSREASILSLFFLKTPCSFLPIAALMVRRIIINCRFSYCLPLSPQQEVAIHAAGFFNGQLVIWHHQGRTKNAK